MNDGKEIKQSVPKTGKENDAREQTNLEAFRQHWEQIRHIERLRLTYTSFYALIAAASIAYIAQTGKAETLLFALLAFISLMGVILCRRTVKAVLYHREKVYHFAEELTKLSNIKKLEEYVPFTKAEPHLWEFWYVRILYIWIYAIAFIVFTWFAICPPTLWLTNQARHLQIALG